MHLLETQVVYRVPTPHEIIKNHKKVSSHSNGIKYRKSSMIKMIILALFLYINLIVDITLHRKLIKDLVHIINGNHACQKSMSSLYMLFILQIWMLHKPMSGT